MYDQPSIVRLLFDRGQPLELDVDILDPARSSYRCARRLALRLRRRLPPANAVRRMIANYPRACWINGQTIQRRTFPDTGFVTRTRWHGFNFSTTKVMYDTQPPDCFNAFSQGCSATSPAWTSRPPTS